MKITDEQERVLSTLICERLSANDANLRAIDCFHNNRNSCIVDALLGDAYTEDESGVIAYYLVKNDNGDILSFFSLKCGLLYDEFIEGERLHNLQKFYDYILKKINDDEIDEEELVTYYKTNMNFRDKVEHGAAMPLYDFACKFMYQETKGLVAAKDDLFSSFNRDKSAV